MIAWVIQISIISFLFIFLVHHLITFLKSTLTIPKIKDLVDSPSEKYKNIYAQLSNNTNKFQTKEKEPVLMKESSMKESSMKESSMKRDLKSFLKKQLSSDQSEMATDYTFERGGNLSPLEY